MLGYVLIVMMFAEGPTGIEMQEFGNKAGCENAIKEMERIRAHVIPLTKGDFIATCVPRMQ